MTAEAIGSAIIGALTSGLGMIETVAGAILGGFETLFITESGLSVLAIVMLTFGGVALAIGVGRLVLRLVRSKVG